MLLDHVHDKVISKKDVYIQNGQKRRKNMRFSLEFRNVCKHETAISEPGKALRRIKTFLSKSRKYQFESEDKVSASSKYFK